MSPKTHADLIRDHDDLRKDHADLRKDHETLASKIDVMNGKLDNLVALMSAGSMAASVLKWTATVGAALVAIAAFTRDFWFHK